MASICTSPRGASPPSVPLKWFIKHVELLHPKGIPVSLLQVVVCVWANKPSAVQYARGNFFYQKLFKRQEKKFKTFIHKNA